MDIKNNTISFNYRHNNFIKLIFDLLFCDQI